MNAADVADAFVWLATAGAFFIHAAILLGAACLLRLLYRGCRWAWDQLGWWLTTRQAATAALPEVSAIEGIEQLEDELADMWQRMQNEERAEQ